MDAYSLLLKKMPKDEVEKKISGKVTSMGGFLTREAGARIVANEMGLWKEEKILLSEIKDGASSSFVVAKVARILSPLVFGNGKKMRKIALADGSGERELKLWNEDCNIANTIHAGDVVEVRGIYCKNEELSLGYSGELKVVERASFADLGALEDLEGESVNASGYVETGSEFREFEKNGRKGQFCSFAISDGKNSTRVVIWDRPEKGKGLSAGMEVKVENAKVKNRELHMNAHSRLFVKRRKDGVGGRVESLSVAGKTLKMKIDDKKLEFSREEALFLLGAKIADDIELKTVVELKKKNLLGKNVFLEMKDGKAVKLVVKD